MGATAVIVADTSAWVDRVRRRPTRAAARLEELWSRPDEELVTTDAIALELLAGARSESDRRAVEQMIAAFPRIDTTPADFDEAAAIYRACRHQGATPRGLLDCLIAAVAMRIDAAVLHNDRDFDTIAQHVELRIDS
jgi:hypothetical protein